LLSIDPAEKAKIKERKLKHHCSHAASMFLLSASIPKGGVISELVMIGERQRGAALKMSAVIFSRTVANLSTGTRSIFVSTA